MNMKHRIHPFTTIGALFYLIGVAAAFLQPSAAPVLVAIAYGCTLLEFMKFTSRFQFGMLLLAGATLGLLLDIRGSGLPVLTMVFVLAALATFIRQAKMQLLGLQV